jgi:3-oxoadipate enol-lactonase
LNRYTVSLDREVLVRARLGHGVIVAAFLCGCASAGAMSNGVSNGLAYEVGGSGPTVVLLHGGLVDKRLWDEQVPSLAPHFRVIRYDLRGYGSSPLPEQGRISHVKDLRDLLKDLGVEKASLVGLSLGGMVALDYALDYPGEVEQLVLVGPGLRGYVAAPDPLVEEAYRRAHEDPKGAAGAMMDQVGWISPEAGPIAHERMRRMLTENVQTWAFMDPTRLEWSAVPTIERLGDLQVPTLLVVGDKDMSAILEIADTLTTKIPSIQKVTISGGSHHPNLDRPKKFNQTILSFLRHP